MTRRSLYDLKIMFKRQRKQLTEKNNALKNG